MYYGLFTEYGLTKNFTIGADILISQSFTSQNGKIGGKIEDKNFLFGFNSIFGRYNFFHTKHLFLSFYISVSTPNFGKGNGRMENFKPYNKISNEWRIETGWRFDSGNYFTINFGYKAQYNRSFDIFTFKITWFYRLPYNFMILIYLKKNAYINKGNKLYAFAQNNHFNLDAFNFINNSGYVGFDVFLGYKISNGKVIVIAYNHSLHSSIFGNKGMNYNYRAFYIEFWWYINFN